MSLPAVRALLRLASRDAWRHRSRSLLILLTLTLPVAGLAGAVTLVHALSVPAATKADWMMGRADAVLHLDTDDDPSPTAIKAALARALPAGSRTLVSTNGSTRLTGPDGLLREVDLTDLAYAQPLAAGMVRQLQGRAPRTAGEVTVASPLARAAHLRLGSRLVLRDIGAGVTETVVGIAEIPSQLDYQQVWTAPGALADSAYVQVSALVVLPAGVSATTWATRLTDGNVQTRDSVLHPPTHPSTLASSQSAGLQILVVGLALLEAVLMAGAAFGVGARRSQRDLALLGATGGDAAQVRGVVLSAALILGTIAGLVGTGLGLVAAWGLLPQARSYSNHDYVGVHPRPAELAAAVGLGILTALVSAWLPARGAARAPVLASLQGRRGTVRSSPARARLALATAAFGTVCCAWAGRTQGLGDRQFDAILCFAAVAELGFAGCAPSLVGLAGRLGGRLPLAMRLSLRDIARNRSRTGPAVAAIMATLSGVVAMGVYTASEHAQHVADHTPALPARMAALYSSETAPPAGLDGAVASSLHATATYAFGDGQSGPTSAFVQQLGTGQRSNEGTLTIAGPGLLTALGIGQAAPALAAGKVVVINGDPIDNGTVTLLVSSSNGSQTARSVPAVRATIGSYGVLGAAVISAQTARGLGLDDATHYRLWTTPGKPTQRELDAANAVLLADSTRDQSLGQLTVETGVSDGKLLLVPLALLAISTLVTFGVTTISTALSAAEGRSDLATLSAVGATASVRRRLAMGQAGVLALLGGILGIAAGLVPIGAVIAVRSDVLDFTVPWQVIALALVGVPVVAAAGAGALTRSRLPLARRLG